MKKMISIILCLAVILAAGTLCAYAAQDSANVFVTITDKDGAIAVAAQAVAVTDTDQDGALTVTDALYCAHEAFYDGGAAAGYATKATQYGLSLDKLWGTANGGSYGYYVNGASAWSLTDPVKDGDYLYAFTYTDLVKWSDKFSTFDQFAGDVDAGKGVELTLTYVADYDEYYMPVFKPLGNAELLIDGEACGVKTDENGKAKVTFTKNGTAIVSAKSADVLLAPPVFRATVSGAVEETQAPTEAPTEAATQAATTASTPDQSSPSNPNAVKTDGQNGVIYLMLGLMAIGFGVILFRRKYEK